jgi:hypothetical protein
MKNGVGANPGRIMQTTDPLKRLDSVLAGTVRLASELKAEYRMEAVPGSKADTERAEGVTAGRYRPLVEAYSMSESRLVAAGSHLLAAGVLLGHGPLVRHAICALARTALETSARVAWVLEPGIDGRTRALRGIAELMYAFREESKFPIPAFQDLAKARLQEVIEGAESSGLSAERSKKGEVLHFGERRPEATEVVRQEVGLEGEIIYRELSGVAHGNLTAHVRQVEPVPADEQLGITLKDAGLSLTRPGPLTELVKPLGHVWSAYNAALGRKVLLYGWDRYRYRAWTTEASREVDKLIRSGGGAPKQRWLRRRPCHVAAWWAASATSSSDPSWL